MLPGGLCGLWACISLIDEGQFDALARSLLHGGGETSDLGAVVGGGRRHMKREQVAECVNGQMQLGALLALGPIITGPMPAFGRRSQCPAIEQSRCRLGRTTGGQTQKRPRVLSKDLKEPALSQRIACW